MYSFNWPARVSVHASCARSGTPPRELFPRDVCISKERLFSAGILRHDRRIASNSAGCFYCGCNKSRCALPRCASCSRSPCSRLLALYWSFHNDGSLAGKPTHSPLVTSLAQICRCLVQGAFSACLYRFIVGPGSSLRAKLHSSLGRKVAEGRKIVFSLLVIFFSNKVLNGIIQAVLYMF